MISSGVRLGSYEVIKLLGAGGECYAYYVTRMLSELYVADGLR